MSSLGDRCFLIEVGSGQLTKLELLVISCLHVSPSGLLAMHDPAMGLRVSTAATHTAEMSPLVDATDQSLQPDSQ